MPKEISENIQEYLEVLYKEGIDRTYVSTTTISNNLNIAPGSVTQMLKKLDELGYIKYVPYKGAILTNEGYKEAENVTRKHRILERFLKDVLKIKDENVHEQACEMEHSLSDEAERALCHMLEHPDICPDNQLIPPCRFDFNNCEECINNHKDIEDIRIRNDNLKSVTKLTSGQVGYVSFIRGDEEILARILSKGIAIGTKISYDSDDEGNNDINVIVNNTHMSLSEDIANNIFIKIED